MLTPEEIARYRAQLEVTPHSEWEARVLATLEWYRDEWVRFGVRLDDLEAERRELRSVLAGAGDI